MNQSFRYLLSNFLFTGIYAFFAYTISYNGKYSSLLGSLYICYGIYNSLQIGGAWLLDRIFQKYAYSIKIIITLRILGILLLLPQNPITLYFSFTFFGLSAASFYVRSRKLMAEIQKNEKSSRGNLFVIFSISTNIAFLLFPYLGSLITSLSNYSIWLGFVLITLLFSSYVLIPNKDQDFDFNQIKPRNESKNINPENLNYEKFHWYDFVRLLVFLITYGTMITMAPFKIKYFNLSDFYVGFFFFFHSGIIILIQLILKNSTLLKYSDVKMEFINWISLITMIIALTIKNEIIYFLMVISWAICESYQMPAMEELIFKKRKYSKKVISRLLILDSIISLISPQLNKKVFK